MRTLPRVAFAALAGLLALAHAKADAPRPEGRKLALLVGVNAYESRKLENLHYAERDVTDLAGLLKDSGFTVRLLLGSSPGKDEATHANVEAALGELLKGAGKHDTVLLGFSGHGAQLFIKEKGADGAEVEREAPFYCPKDGTRADASTLVSLNAILRTLDERGGGSNLMLVDACRNVVDPNKGARGGVDGSRVENLGEGTAVFFSCSARQRSRETERAGGGHGVFFHFVLEGLRGAEGAKDDQGRVTWQSLVPYVKRRVRAEGADWFPGLPAEERQRPHDIANLTDDPVLTATPAVAGPPPTATTPAARPAPLDCTTEAGLRVAEVRKAQEAWAKYLGREVEEEDEIAPGVKMKFVLVPPGKYLMGSTKAQIEEVRRPFPNERREHFDREAPRHEVELTRPFYLGVHDVTRGQFARFAEATGYKTEAEADGKGGWGADETQVIPVQDPKYTWRDPGFEQDDDHPVVEASWNDAVKFCGWLGKNSGGGPAYRLPTEAEWEYACRGGRASSHPFGVGDGETLSSSEANFDDEHPYAGAEKGPYLGKTSPVGSYRPNALGLYDMQGNVYQWCGDWYADYTSGRATDPSGPAEGSVRVFRGGAWDEFPSFCRAACRGRNAPSDRFSIVGFRVVRILPGMDK